MDIDSNKLKQIYNQYFSMQGYADSINTKFALISLICYVVTKLQEKKPDVTFYQIIKQLSGDNIPADLVTGLSIMCEDFSNTRKDFPTFGIEEKDIPKKIKEIFFSWTPF